MCDYCGCRSMPVIDDLGADHDDLLARARRVRGLLDAGDRDQAGSQLADLLDRLRVHTEVEEASVFAGLRAAGEMVDYVDSLAGEHAYVWAVVDALDPSDTAGWDAAVVGLLDDLQHHIGREEYDLFPATLVAIGPGEWEGVAAAAAKARSHA